MRQHHLLPIALCVLFTATACPEDHSADDTEPDGSNRPADTAPDPDTGTSETSDASNRSDTSRGSDTTAATDGTSDTGTDAGTPRPSPEYGLSDRAILDRLYRPKRLPKSYERTVEPPACDAQNSDVSVLGPGAPEGAVQDAIDDSSIRVICLKPGDYSERFLKIRESQPDGTRQQPRWIRHYNPSNSTDEHPWEMGNPGSRGNGKRVFLGGIYMRGSAWWRFDRIRFARGFQIIESQHVLTNRLMFYENPIEVQMVIKRSSDVVVQNSVIGKTNIGDRDTSCDTDANSIAIQGSSEDIHVVGNELFDFWCGDGVQTLKVDEYCRGFVVQDNDIYTTPAFNKAGHGVENGIDFKCGPADRDTGSVEDTDSEDWALIEGNRLWGGGSEMLFHYPGVSGIVVRQNFLWDLGEFAWQISAKERINREHHVYDNVFFETGGGFKPRHIDASMFARNVFVRARGEDVAWSWFQKPTDNEVRRNVFIETDVGAPCISDRGNVIESNAYFASEPFQCNEPGRIERSEASAAGHDDYTLQLKPFTGPETKTLPGTRVTDPSPHADWFPRSRSE